MLNSKELSQYITNWDLDPKGLQQVGIDLNLKHLYRIDSGGVLGMKETKLPSHTLIAPNRHQTEIDLADYWFVCAGDVYEVVFEQGCQIPANVVMFIRQRSSLLRMGGLIHSCVFDPGFKTENIGTMMIALRDFYIEKGARICQIYGHQCTEVSKENLYDGQFQNDKQRNTDAYTSTPIYV